MQNRMYLREVLFLILPHSAEDLMQNLCDSLTKEGVVKTKLIRKDLADLEQEETKEGKEQKNKEEGRLWITDQAFCAKYLLKKGCAVLACMHEKNRDQDFFGIPYALEDPVELEGAYLEGIYRRYAKIPWDICETKRLRVRESISEDAESFQTIYEHPLVARFMEPLPEGDKLQSYFTTEIQKGYDFFGFGVWTIVEKETETVVGRAGYSFWDGYEDPQLGYVIGVPWQRKGYGKEACRAILDYARKELEMPRVLVFVEQENEASCRLCLSLGLSVKEEIQKEGKKYFVFT